MKIEVGKTYISRNKRLVFTIDRELKSGETGYEDGYRYVGISTPHTEDRHSEFKITTSYTLLFNENGLHVLKDSTDSIYSSYDLVEDKSLSVDKVFPGMTVASMRFWAPTSGLLKGWVTSCGWFPIPFELFLDMLHRVTKADPIDSPIHEEHLEDGIATVISAIETSAEHDPDEKVVSSVLVAYRQGDGYFLAILQDPEIISYD
jgi:hypothetical protein